MRNRSILTLLLAVLVVACRSGSPDEQLVKAMQPVSSWLATLEMTGRKWSDNSVPASFVRSTTAAAGKAIGEAAEAAARSNARPGLREPVRKLLAEAAEASSGLRRAADAGDRPAAAREIERLAALHVRFEALAR